MGISIFQYNNDNKELAFLSASGWNKSHFDDFPEKVKQAVETITNHANDLRPIEEKKLEEAYQEQQELADENVKIKQENATVKAENQSVKQENEQLTEANEALEIAVNNLFTLTEASEYIKKYPDYETNKEYKQGDVFKYEGNLYVTTQPHTSQADWAPDVAQSLYVPFKVVGKSADADGVTSDIKEFRQPTGAHDAYKKGDKVRYNGKVYESLIENNAYSPDAYPQGWKEVN